MRITKKIISLLLVVSMLASFFAMSGFEASANLQNQQKTDFGIHFDDTTRKLKVLQLPDIQTSVSGGAISERTRETIRLLMQRYNPDVILLTGDQTQGGSTSTKAQWESAVGRVYSTFSPYMKSNCKVIAVPGNHEYDFGSLNHQWDYQMGNYSYFVDWDNNFSTIDLDGAPGAGVVTVSASSTNKAVALNFAMINSKGDDEDGYLRPGGDNETAYQQIVDWYTNMNNTLASSAYSYKAQVTGQASAYVPTLASQHVILQEIYTTGAMIAGDASNGVVTPSRYTHLTSASYVRLDPANNPTGAMNEGPCPTWLYNGATRALYDALHNPGNCLGMVFGHDHDNWFDVTDDNGFRFIMGGALTQENYLTDENPKGRYFEFTLNDATGEVDMTTEVKSYTQLAIASSADVDEDRIEVINGEGVQLVNTLSVPKTVYIGDAGNLADVRAKQEFGNVVQTQLLDYKTKLPYDQDLAVSYCLPSGATDVTFSAHRTSAGTQASMTNLGTETTSEGVLYKYKITPESVLTADEYINFTVKYTYNGTVYEIRNSTVVENIKQPAGYNDWFRGWRESNNSKHYVDLAYISTLSGANAYSYSRETSVNGGDFNSNTYYNYSLMIADVDQSWYNKAGDTRFSMFRYSPSRVEVTDGHVSQRAIYASPVTDIYIDSSALKQVSATDTRLDIGTSIDFWIQKDLDRGFNEYVAGIGFYAGDQDYVPGGATIDPNDNYANYNAAVTAENGSTGSDGAQDNATIFLYDSYARQQSLNGLGTTHVNANLSADNLIGKMAGQYVGYPLVVDSEAAALALNGQQMTMFTGVRNKGNSDGGYRILLYAVSPFLLNFHTYDKSDLRELTMAELMNPRKQSDYPNATQMMWDAYMSAYQNALNCYAQIKTSQTDINNYDTALQNAIAALLNSNKGKPDEGNLLKGTSQFGTIDVPPIIYVSGSTIQTAAPYTDRVIKFDVPSGATNVSCTVVNAGNDNVNSAVTTSTTQSGTHFETTITGGTATAGGSIYYKLSYTLNQDLNGDGKNDTYTQYAASYVKAVPNTEGMWIHQTYRQRANADANSAIYMKATLSMDNNIFASRGVSGIMSLYGGVQGTSFHSTVVNGTTNEYTRYGDEGVYWAVGTASQWPRESGYGAAGRVLFFNDRSRAKENGDPVYWNGLKPYKKDGSGTLNTMDNNSDEYIVANIYFDPQATGSSVAPRLKLTLTTSANDSNNPTVYQYWDTNNYRGVNYGGDYVNKSPNMTSTNMFTPSQATNNYWSSGNGITLNDGAVWEVYLNANKALNQFGDVETYSRLMIHAEKLGDSWLGDVWNNSIMGYAFIFNRVDRSQAHQAIKWATGVELVEPSALFNEDDMDPNWWAQWRAEVMKAYTKCGNLWDTTDFDTSLLVNLWQNPVYKDADYSKLVNTLNSITGNALVNESISDYEALTFAVSSGDDQRYAGSRYAKEMFLNNASDLIATIKNRVTVYAETDSNLIAASDAAGNLHDSHLDVRFQSYINDYADDLQEAWDKLRLAPADYTYFNKYSGYYSEADDTVTFMRDEYAGYHNDGAAKNYANEKALASGMYTYATYSAFVNSLNIDRTLKKPSESAAIGSLPRLYPQTFTYKNVTAPDVADTTACLYNTARDAYEALEFRKAGEYYSANGTYTEGGVTYYANYNKQDRGASYYYTPVFKTSYNTLSADIANAGYVVTDVKVKPTYTAGNNGDTNGNGTYDAGEIWVTNGLGEYIKTINPWTDASWGGASYGFKNAYEEHILNSTSTYQSTNSSDKWVLALYVEAEILPDIAAVDYYYEKLVPASYDMSQLEIQQHSYAEYEKGGSGYDALAGYVIYDANGNELKDGAQWYTADTWADYQAAKVAQPSIIDGATLAENQDAINYMTQTVYQKRAALQLRPMDDFRVNEENAILGETDFASINSKAEEYYNEINNRKVKVFALRAEDPKSYVAVAGNNPLFKDHNYYKSEYITTLGGLLDNDAGTGVKDFAGKTMVSSIAAYISAVNAFKATYDENVDPTNMNKADTSTLQLLLNKTWIPEFDKYGAGNYNNGNFLISSEFDGSKWYSNWEVYDQARKNALSFFNATEFDGADVVVNLNSYGNKFPAGDFYVDDQGAEFTVDKTEGSATYGQPVSVDGTSLDGTVNKVAYDLVVAYYKLQLKKVNDSDDEIAGISGYQNILKDMLDKLELLKKATVGVLTVDTDTSSATFGQLITVQRGQYDEAYINTLQTYYNTVAAMEEEVYASNYTTYIQTVQSFNTMYADPDLAKVYFDGWNSFYTYFTIKAGSVGSITNNETLDAYLQGIFGDNYNAKNDYSGDDYQIRSTRENIENISALSGTDIQPRVNTLVQRLYDDFTSASTSFVPTQILNAATQARAVISNTSGKAYDPLQLNNRPQATGITEYTQESMDALEAIIDANSTYKVTFWDADPTKTGYNDKAGTVVDGEKADLMWASAGLTTEGGVEYAKDKSVNTRYVLVEGGRFLDALKDAVAHAESKLYNVVDGQKVLKTAVAVSGDGETKVEYCIYTEQSVNDLLPYLTQAASVLAETEGNYTEQKEIDKLVFNILEQTDDTIFVSDSNGELYNGYTSVYNNDGLVLEGVNLDFLKAELATKYTYDGITEAAQTLVNEVWGVLGENGTYTLVDKSGYTYFTETSWNAYTTSYSNGAAILPGTTLTALNQADINTLAANIYNARDALQWNTIGETDRWKDADKLGAKIEQINAETVIVYLYTNSKLSEDGTYLTAPYYTEQPMSKYGSEATEAIISAWNTFKGKYPADADYSHYAQMVLDYAELQEMYDNLQAKSMTNDSDFAQGANQLIADFIGGSYDYATDTYTADYLETKATYINDAEKAERETQENAIKGYLNSIDALLNGNAISDKTTIKVDGTTKSVTYIEALNHYTMELYKYVTTTPAQYAGFALDMRQDMYDYFNTTITVLVETKHSASDPVYTTEVRVFPEASVKNEIKTITETFGYEESWPKINQLDSSVGIGSQLVETFDYNQELEIFDKDGQATGEFFTVYDILYEVGAYSEHYTNMRKKANSYASEHLEWLRYDAVYEEEDLVYILADPTEFPELVEGATFAYSMDSQVTGDGNWYTVGYGDDIMGNSTKYYLAASSEEITGSDCGGWFTDESYKVLTSQLEKADKDIVTYSGVYYGNGTQANSVYQTMNSNKTTLADGESYLCWSAANRKAYIDAIKLDQATIDETAKDTYEAIIGLKLLPATDAYREVAGLIYAALGQVPNYHPDNGTGVIIDKAYGDTLTDYEMGGRLFNVGIRNQLGTEGEDYFKVVDENGIRYYAPGLPAGYTNGVTDVNNILKKLEDELTDPFTIDMAVLVSDNTANNGINSVKEKILAELEKLTLGLADLSLITSLTKAFLYNNPSHADSLGSYNVNSEFFARHDNKYGVLGLTPNASNYKTDTLMKMAGNAYHASGFYDFSMYTKESLEAVLSYMLTNSIINGDTYSEVSNRYDYETKEGFNVLFSEDNQGTLYSYAVTQQDKVYEIYAGLTNVINQLELRPADTVALKAEIAEADSIKLNKDLYDYESAEGKAAWDEFIEASDNAASYAKATIVNQVQVGQAEEALSKAIKALKLNVDSYAPVVTIHNTQNDITKFYNAHSEELKGVISSANQMVAPSYMEPGLGGYTLYVYTNQINPHIVVSLEDAVEVANDDGSTRDVKASKPEKMTVTAQAMSGVTASVITPVLNENGEAKGATSVAIAGKNANADITSVSTQTAKTLVKDAAGNETYSYAESSSAYVVLNPSFEGVADGAQSAVKYSIDASDSAVTKDYVSGVISNTPNSANQFKYAETGAIVDSASGNDITVFVYYMNAMPADNNDSGVVNGTINASAVLTDHEMNGIAADKWTNHAMLYRTFANPVRSWEFSETPAQLEKKNAAYYDPNFGENNFGSFVYILDPNAASNSFDYEVASAYFAENGGADAAKAKAIDLLKSNSTYISQFNEYVGKGSTTGEYGYKHYGATDFNGQYENWAKPMGNIDNGTLVFVHVADRFGNVCNRVIEWKNYDPYTPVLSTSEAGKVSVTEPGGSGVAKVDLFNYMGTSGSSLYIGYLYDMLHIDGPDDMIKYVSEDNSFVISAGAENAGKYFTVAVTDNAGNVGSVPVFADAEGKIVVTVDETFDNVAKYKANPSTNVTTESGEDLGVIEFVFNGSETVILNYSEPTSIVKAGPDGNVFAKRKFVPINIITKAEVESIKLYNVDKGTEEIWTTENVTVSDNGDGTKTWTSRYTFAEGEYNYNATAKVNGNWEASSVDFNFEATTRIVLVKTIINGLGRIDISYNDGNNSSSSLMAQTEVPYGSVVKIEASPTDEASEFYYWKNNYSDRIISTADTMEFVAVTNMEITPQFTTNEVFTNDKKLVVYVNNAENVVDSFELADGEDYKVPAAPSLPEHVFKSWSMTKDEVLASEEKMIVVRPVYSLVVKNTVTLTEGNWTATGAGGYETVGDERPVATISASATDDAGAGFLYWLDAETGDIASYNRTYSFYVIKDTELTPVYGDASAVVPVPVARISTIKYDDKADKVSFFAERSVPAGYTMIQTGIVVTKSASVANNEEAFVLDASGVSKGMSKSVSANGYYSVSIPATSGVTGYARAYVVYANADGDIITYYSPVSSYTA